MTGPELVAAREQLHITQAELARMLGVTRKTLWRWEHDEQRVPGWLRLALIGIRVETGRIPPSAS